MLEQRQTETPPIAQDVGRVVSILYTNHRQETARRRIIPRRLRFGTSPWHPEEQWLLDAIDMEKDQWRTFAMRKIREWSPEPCKPTLTAP